MALPTGAKVFNVIRESSTEVFMNTVPSATPDNIEAISNILFGAGYQPMLNEFVTTLVNRIGLTMIENKSYNNPLAVFKKGSVPLGTDVQNIYTNPANAEQYALNNTEMAKLLTVTKPDTKVEYYRRNRQDLYPATISREELQGAFVSWDKFESYITSIVNSLYSGNYIDEYEYTKQLVDSAYDGGKVIVDTVSAVSSEATAKALVQKARSIFLKMQAPSTEYNVYNTLENQGGTPVKTWSTPERMVVITTADVMSYISVYDLAMAFNMSEADFLGRVIVVDKFANDSIQAVICDESWIQIYDNIFRFDEFYNARTMSWNQYLHAWSIFAISPMANAVVLATEEPKPATAVSLGSATFTLDLNEDAVEGGAIDVTTSTTPADATNSISYSSSNTGVFTATKVTDRKVTLTPIATGTATLTMKADNGVKTTATVTVVNTASE